MVAMNVLSASFTYKGTQDSEFWESNLLIKFRSEALFVRID